ncbi:MAG TPA: CaiB/BaiF CoA-transferase family protein [Conexibacter sp.]|jgi:crotonobetainyl-CoA:carnitine CoA-transferase CaiB-like acyl-CoA transferase
MSSAAERTPQADPTARSDPGRRPAGAQDDRAPRAAGQADTTARSDPSRRPAGAQDDRAPRAASPRAAGPLEGVRVIDLTRLLPGAFATALLGDLGADVIKVEQPGGGDPMRAYEPRIGSDSGYTWVVDRNKRSVALNLRDPRGVDALRRLARGADAVIESFRPGVADRLGIGYDALRAENGALVYCSISGYGADGPLAQAAGHDINYIGRAGLLSLTGSADALAIPGTQVADLAGGALLGLSGMLAALVRAGRTGEGDHVEVAMTDGAFALLALALGAHFADGRTPGAGQELLSGKVPCYNVYDCADGRRLTVGALEPPFWQALCTAIDRRDLLATALDPNALPAWRALFAARPRDAWLAALQDVDACVGPVNDLVEALDDPQLRARGMVVSQAHLEAGERPQLGTPIKLRERPATLRTPAPALGADSRDVLIGDAGLSPDAVDAMLRDGVAQEQQQQQRP